jgi:hypothetical protein
MPRITFPTAFGRCALAWGDAGVTGFELPEAEVRADDLAAPPDWIATLVHRVQRHLAGEWQPFPDCTHRIAGRSSRRSTPASITCWRHAA